MIYLFGVIAAFLLQTLSNKEMGRRFDPAPAGMYFYCAVGLSLVPLGMLPFGGLAIHDFRTLIVAAVFGVDFVATILLMLTTMREGPLSLTSLFIGLSVMFPVLSGLLFFGEALTAAKAIGIGCVLAVVALTSLMGNSSGKRASGRWLSLALLCMVSNGLLCVLQKLQTGWLGTTDNVSFTFYAFLTAALCFWALLLWQTKGKATLKPWLRPSLFVCSVGLGIGTCIGNALVMLALAKIPSVVAFPIITGGLVAATWLASLVIYKETFTMKAIASMLVGLAGIIMLCV